MSLSDLEHVKLFFHSLQFVFPCEGCCTKLQNIIHKNPLHWRKKEDIIEWYEKIRDHWEKKHSSPRNIVVVKFANKNTYYPQTIPLRNIITVQNPQYDSNGKIFIQGITKKNKIKNILLFPTVQFMNQYPIESIKLKRGIDYAFDEEYRNLVKKYNRQNKNN
jgi:hypothetical protein